MKSIGLFESRFLRLLEDANVAGGAGSVFGVGMGGSAGQFGNQFPSQNDSAYAPGDARIPKVLGAKRRKKKKEKFVVQRRPLPGLEL
jgi:hypothetical protein